MSPRRHGHLETVIGITEVAGGLLLLDLQVARGLGDLVNIHLSLPRHLPLPLCLGVLCPQCE
eukprot:11184854-Lingulodinium_polyedra.AAC.1